MSTAKTVYYKKYLESMEVGHRLTEQQSDRFGVKRLNCGSKLQYLLLINSWIITTLLNTKTKKQQPPISSTTMLK